MTHAASSPGLTVQRRFTRAGESVWESVAWRRVHAEIRSADGGVVFQQENVEAPTSWSEQAVRVAAAKYFAGVSGSPERENSIRQLLSRVVETLKDWAGKSGLFASSADVEAFSDELTYVLLHQVAAFNSPVWFNVGIDESPQCSACFINRVEDSMESILELAKVEGMLFKHGSGTGSNLSPLRGSDEPLRNGGTASGPVSFMRGFDAFAGVIKSGGRTRRAAKMVILDADHPDILEFVRSKAREEQKAWVLIDAGYDGAIDGEAYGSVAFQNANHSVRVPAELWEAIERGAQWQTKRRTDGAAAQAFPAQTLLTEIAHAAWVCGDPGVQYDDVIQRWHTCKVSGRINASNPCSEYLFLDDTACNLASINLMKAIDGEGELDIERFEHVVRLMFTAQEILVGNAGYPTPRIRANSHRFRPLGLGYANLGALLMRRGEPYDSDAARATAAAITSLLTGTAYGHSAEMAWAVGPFEAFDENRASMLEVIEMHRAAAEALPASPVANRAKEAWSAALKAGAQYGYRNAQATVLAPTGTIGLLMDCDTTGVEPDIALVKYKRLVGGGALEIVNRVIPAALDALGYAPATRDAIVAYIEEEGTIEGAPGFLPEHLPIFDCAFAHGPSGRTIAPDGHLKMMAAVQPFLSGAISKTVNLPNRATVAQIAEVFARGHRLGLKAVAVYRDGCKRVQPLSTEKKASRDQLRLPHFLSLDHGETPPCPNCGGEQVRSGSCYVCSNCGETTACA